MSGTRFGECGRCRPSRADVDSWLDGREIDIERIERTRRGAHGHVGHLQIARRGFQLGVAEQELNGARIDAGLE